jgi:hypothetical protein
MRGQNCTSFYLFHWIYFFFKENRLGRIPSPLIIDIQDAGTMKRGPCLSSHTAPALSDDDVAPVRGYRMRGEPSSGGEIPVSVELDLSHFSRVEEQTMFQVFSMSAMVVLSASCMVLFRSGTLFRSEKRTRLWIPALLHRISYFRCWLSSMSWYASPRIFRFSNVISPS